MKARKKPIVVDVVHFSHDEWILNPEKYFPMVMQHPFASDVIARVPAIPTLEGFMTVGDGDYIIKGVNGEFYPCKPDIFEKTYDIIE